MTGTAAATALAAATAALALAGNAVAGGGRYSFDGGSPAEQAQVRGALDASSFDWDAVPLTVTIHIAHGASSRATPGQIWLDADLLDAGTYAWGVVQHEYAHQVDFFLLTNAMRAQLQTVLGGATWWRSTQSGLAPDGSQKHAQLASERFASTLAWAYWPSPANVLRPHSPSDEAGGVAPARFRTLLAALLTAEPQ